MAKKEVKEKEVKEKETKDVENIKTNIHEIEIKIDGEDWKNAIDKAFKQAQKTVKIDGFRPGKVPREIFEKRFGKESLYKDAADEVIQLAYIKALSDSKLVPVVKPEVALKSVAEEAVEFVFRIITKPEIKIKKYKGLNIKPEECEVTEEEINHELGHILEKYVELEVKDEGTVENGDVAIIDFEGFKDGVAFEGGKGENYSLEIGSHTFIPGFEEQIIGMAKNEEKDLDITFPEDYGAKELAGAKVVFKVKVNEIKEKKTRELDEEFFEDLAMEGVNSEETLKEEIKKSIETHKKADIENKYIDKLLEELAKNVEVDIPEEMVNEEVDRLLERYEENMKMQGISLDLYYKFTNSTEKDLRNQLEKEAYSNVLYRLMLEEIMNIEKVEVSEEDAKQELKSLAEKYKMSEEELQKEIGGLDMIQYDLEIRKTIELLKELNK